MVVNCIFSEHAYSVLLGLKASRALAYRPFSKLHTDLRTNEQPGNKQLLKIETLMAKKLYAEARDDIASLIELTLEGLRYLETSVLCYLPFFSSTFICFIVTIGL